MFINSPEYTIGYTFSNFMNGELRTFEVIGFMEDTCVPFVRVKEIITEEQLDRRRELKAAEARRNVALKRKRRLSTVNNEEYVNVY